jgi:hypothetical protein
VTDADQGPTPPVVRRLVGVYDADHTLRGELLYWVGARLGRVHCGLCAITHGAVRAKREWQEYRSGLPAPFDTFHRDDQPAAVRALGVVPVVAAETDDGGPPVVLLGPADLDACGGSVDALALAIRAAVTAHGMAWPG